ncbi:MAG TPA: heavy-metal-associated domain-containing protein [Bacteroidia bacterium]|nr:heavy-metal-associated domain-containing protein [Bacteroidia bacterium]
MKKLLTAIFSVAFFHFSFGQFKKVVIRVDGLTCSACSYATQHSLQTLSFVSDVQMDLNNNLATVTFREGRKVSIDSLAIKVVDAGFSVGSLSATMDLSGASVTDSTCFVYQNDCYYVLAANGKKLGGTVDIRFVGEAYMKKSEYKPWKSKLNGSCGTSDMKGKTYYVTL